MSDNMHTRIKYGTPKRFCFGTKAVQFVAVTATTCTRICCF